MSFQSHSNAGLTSEAPKSMMQKSTKSKKNKHKKGQEKDPKLKFHYELDDARKFLVDDMPEQAIKIAMRALEEYRAKREGIEMLLMPAYFVLAEAYISDKNTSEEKEDRLKRAEDVLFAAYMAIINNKDKY